MNESFSSRVNVRDLVKAAQRFENYDSPLQVFVVVTIDDHGSLTIAPDPVESITLENIRQ